MLTQTELAKRLAEARERAGLTQQQVADSLEVPRSAVSQMEVGNRTVSSIELVRLARLYEVDVSDLLEGRNTEGEVLALFRMDPVLADADLQADVREALDICRIISDLDELLQESISMFTAKETLPPPDSRSTADQQGRDLARRVREEFGLGYLPIGDLHALLLRQGIAVAEHELPDSVSGIFLSTRRTRPFILLNKEHTGTRRRFSLAHEYCHALVDANLRLVVSRENDSGLREARSNSFASSFLLPREGVAAFVAATGKKGADLDFADVADLAYKYGTSYEAALFQLSAMGILSGARTKELQSEAMRGAAYLHRKYPEKPASQANVTLREWAFGRMLRAFEQDLISRRKALSLARELGYKEEAVADTLDSLRSPDAE